MTRWAASVEYAGTRYSGWQRQVGRDSVQQSLEAAMSAVANHPLATVCAGRTDTGVHAFGQVVHFDSPAARAADRWLLGVNSLLPEDISLRWVQPVADDFDARRKAVSRRYRYVIFNDRARAALLAGRATFYPNPLEAPAMHRAAQALVGEHDFSAYRAAECQSSTPMRNVHAISVKRTREFVVIDVRANAFLHHMVRNIAGVLMAIGTGRRPESWTAELLAGRDRTLAAMTAAAQGLYFVGPDYPPEYRLPAPPTPWLPA